MIQQFLTAIYATIARIVTMDGTSQLALVPARRRRGATFIEYALLAGIAVIVFLAISGPLRNLMTGIIDSVSDALGL